MKQTISNALKHYGSPAHILGHQYIGYAVELVMEDSSIMHQITKRLYPAVAKHFNTTGSRVERAIRHAVEVAFDNLKPDIIYEAFGNTISATKGKATNTQFIAMLVEHLSNSEVAV